MKIGCHVSMSADDYVLGSVREAVGYGANALMIYTGAPQNTKRKAMSELKIKEAHAVMKENGIETSSLIVHAPYIINLANCTKPETFDLGVSFLAQEIKRVQALDASVLVLHPGCHVSAGEEAGLQQIVKGLDLAMQNMGGVHIAIETMAGKGSELGYQFSHIRYIMDHVQCSDHIMVCMDTCHLHDAGFDMADFDSVLDEFDQIIGLDRLACVHLNDSKNIRGARKDRHANIGYGEIGFDSLCAIAHHPRIAHVVKILETPWIANHAPYAQEILMLKRGVFNDHLQEELQNTQTCTK